MGVGVYFADLYCHAHTHCDDDPLFPPFSRSAQHGAGAAVFLFDVAAVFYLDFRFFPDVVFVGDSAYFFADQFGGAVGGLGAGFAKNLFRLCIGCIFAV